MSSGYTGAAIPKSNWAGNIYRMSDNKWSQLITQWVKDNGVDADVFRHKLDRSSSKR